MTLTDNIIEVLENNDWNLCGEVEGQDGKFYVEIESFSPCGENIVETVWFDGTDDGFINGVKKCAYDFDADEHAEALIDYRGEDGVPDSIRDLINDADAIQEMLDELVDELDKLCIENVDAVS